MARFKLLIDNPNSNLLQAVTLVEGFLVSPKLLSFIRAKKTWEYTNDNGETIAVKLSKGRQAVIKLYTPWYPWSKAIASTTGNVISLNSRKMNRSIESIANTLIHEYCHVINYGHGNNSPIGKENSVPYWVGNKFERMLKGLN